MEKALKFSRDNLARETYPSMNDQFRIMTKAVERLNSAVIAVLVITSLPETDDVQRPRWVNMTPAGIEAYMVQLTGYSGWRGVIETLDNLRNTLVLICGKSAKAVSPGEATGFVRVSDRALSQLDALVSAIVDSWRRAM